MSPVRRNLKVGVSGVRGIVGETLFPALAADFAASFGNFSGRGCIIVGRDTRPSGVMIENAVAAGLLASGADVLLAGIVPTPTLQIVVRHYDAAGAVAITASHNPSEWNALKFIDSSAFFLTENGMNALLDTYNQPQDSAVEESDYRSIGIIDDAFKIHADRIRSRIDIDAIRAAKLKVAADCCNGVGAYYTKEFLESLGCEVIPLFDEKDGLFRRPPEPVAANLAKLCETVTANACAVGFAQDPDGDRISLVDECGHALGEQYSTLIPALRVLQRNRGPVVANIQTTKALGDLAARFDVPVFYSKVGEVNVAEAMRLRGAVFGCEGGSGGILWSEVHPCRDSFSAMALTLEELALSRKKVSEIMSGMSHYCSAVRKLPCSAQGANQALRAIAKRYTDRRPLLLDGVRIEFEDSWVLVRQSNTEPVIRIYAESVRSSGDAAALAERFLAELNELAEE